MGLAEGALWLAGTVFLMLDLLARKACMYSSPKATLSSGVSSRSRFRGGAGELLAKAAWLPGVWEECCEYA